MTRELIGMTARAVVAKLKAGEVTPLDLIDAAAARISEVEPAVNALPTLCLDRARDRAKKLMHDRPIPPADGRGWLGGLPVAIKDLTDVGGVRTTYGSPIFRDHVPEKSHPLVERIEARGGIVIAKSNTPEFGAGSNTFNEVFGKTRNPWNTSLTCGGSTGGGAVSLATGEAWLAHGTDHGGSLRKPGTYCSVVGMRPSPGRVTRGAVNNMFSMNSVHGPMARNVPDLALFLDTMAGLCKHDPLTFDAPQRSFEAAALSPKVPRRVAFSADLGISPLDAETRDICAKAARRFTELGAIVEEACPDFGPAAEVFMVLRSMVFLVDREFQIQEHRDLIKPDIIWNTEKAFQLTPSKIAWAERERAALVKRVTAFFDTYDYLLVPGAASPAWDVDLRFPEKVGGAKLENYMAASMLTAGITITSCPALAIPCGFDQYGRPVGLQIVGRPRDEAGLLQVGALFEGLTGLDKLVPIDPRPGTVPPYE